MSQSSRRTIHQSVYQSVYATALDNNGYRSFELPGARPHYNPDRPGQVEHIALDLDLDLAHQRYSGTCAIRLNPVRNGIERLTLDAVKLDIHSVKAGKHKLHFDYDGEQLQVSLKDPTRSGKPITLEITYSNDHPQRGLYFIAPDQHYPQKPVQVWTQGEDEDSRFWFPCFDYPGQLATSEIRVRVPKHLLAISNGELLETIEDGNSKIYHWFQKEVHPTYLMTLAVGDFAELRDEWHGKPVTYYVEKGREDDARRSMGKTPQMIEFFSQTFGYAYPFPKYAQVCVDDFIFGGMENTSTTLLTDRCLIDERAALDNRSTEALVAHELAHQWFGDLVVIKHWSHAWIKEGMASYSEVLWTEHEYTADDAAYYRLNEARSYISEDSSRYRRPIVTHVYREAIELYDRHLYEKGSCVYHMIRRELGDEEFFDAVHTFVNDNAHKTVETVDLLRAIEKATGRNLQFLFDQYVYRGGHPDYKVSYSWDGDSKLAKVTLVQTQATDGDTDLRSDLFDLKIPIGFGYAKEEEGKGKDKAAKPLATLKTFTVRIHEREQSFYFPLDEKPQFVSFDVGNHVLKEVTLDYGVAELKAQLKHDPDPVSRIYAAIALAKKGNLEAVKALGHALAHDPFWGVRAEVAAELASIKLDQSLEALLEGLKDADARVRRSVVEALAQIKTQESYKAIKTVAEKGDPSYYVEAAALRSLGTVAASPLNGKSKEEKVIKLFREVLDTRAGWNETVRSGAIGGLSKLKESAAALELILDYTAIGTPQALRLAAIRALGPVSLGQEKPQVERILDRLRELSDESFFLTQVSVVMALGQMQTTRAATVLQSLADRTPDGRVRRIAEEAVQRVMKNAGQDQAVKKLQQELDQLKKDNQTLKSRLESLEAKAAKG
ncbi:M1 family metallopeptidase [Thermoleptolyngbya sichuanensis A183]|uniref:Aminopeptidase N n=1 Tax=Thermoleptolyngbya sichuanensis A183 TaxID=2737172 RepID=A0A6M8B6R6_9CYAN|nr:M1 family metallopeptidase [Thermoleptolyngbya sichuanensis]QKD82188.1 M1 family metallopeptidase [Thermoleptolyngbya sichuanensis A183]